MQRGSGQLPCLCWRPSTFASPEPMTITLGARPGKENVWGNSDAHRWESAIDARSKARLR